MDENYFKVLYALNVNDHVEVKDQGGVKLSYLSWPYAWAETKERYPDAQYTIHTNENGLPYFVAPDLGIMVHTSVTISGITHSMWLPVMDGANRAMKTAPYTYTVRNKNYRYARLDPQTGKMVDKFGNEQTEYIEKLVEAATMTDINRAIMRCLVKNLAMHGVGLYIYAGEDLPEAEKAPVNGGYHSTEQEAPTMCADCGKPITAITKKDGTQWNVSDIRAYTKRRFGREMCPECAKKAAAKTTAE